MQVTEWISKTEKLIEGATPGPWVPDFGNWQIESRNESSYRNGVCTFAPDNRDCVDGSINPLCAVEDAQFIADARTSLPIALKLIKHHRKCLRSIEIYCGYSPEHLGAENYEDPGIVMAREIIETMRNEAKEELRYWKEE